MGLQGTTKYSYSFCDMLQIIVASEAWVDSKDD